MRRSCVLVIASYHSMIGCLDEATGCTLQGVACQDRDSPSGCCHICPDTICILDLQWQTAAVKNYTWDMSKRTQDGGELF